jgi:ComF family protein
MSGFRTCAACRKSSPLFAVATRADYTGIAKQLVWQLKFQGAQAAATEMARQLAPLVAAQQPMLVVPVPTATSRRRQRGYDQAVLLARALANELAMPYLSALRRTGQHHQVGASRLQRVTQLQDAYRCVYPGRIAGKHVLLVDDVLTTGATLESAARAIKAAGAARICAITFAQA